MKTLLYTGHNEAYKPLADITVPRMAAYAEKHGMDFKCYTEPLMDVPDGIYWTGACGALKAFDDGYNTAIYLDVDQLVTNMDTIIMSRIAYIKTGFHVSKDWGEDAVKPWQFSMCGFVAHRDSKTLLEKAMSLEEEYRGQSFPEQRPMQDIALNFPDMVTVHARKVFNCVPDAVCPGKVPEKWVPGDWAAHITMAPMERRIEIANEIINSQMV